MRLVYKEPVHAELFKGHNIVLARPVVEFFQSGLQGAFCPFKLFDGKLLRVAVFQFLQPFLDFPYLFLQQPLPALEGHGEAFKLGVSHNHRVIVAGGDLGAELLTVGAFKVLFLVTRMFAEG